MDDTEASSIGMMDKVALSKALAKIPIRVSITGTRGKSSQAYLIANALTDKKLWTVAKVTGDTPFFMDRNGVYNILRKNMKPVFLDETAILSNMCAEAGCYPDAIVLENQAIQPYTMYAFHELYSKPNYIIVTNVRRDHQEFLGKTKSQIAHAYGKAFARARHVISGDRDKEVNEILGKYAEEIGAEFHQVGTPFHTQGIPGAENVYVAQSFLELASHDFPEYGDLRMGTGDLENYVSMVENMISLHPSPMGIDWFDGAKLNDIDSTHMVMNYLLKRNPDKEFSIIAYFRGDRPARTITFSQYFNEMVNCERLSRIYLAGTGAEYVHNRIRRAHRHKFHVVKDTVDSASSVIKEIRDSDRALVTVANAVSPFMRHVRSCLVTPSERHVVYQNPRQSAEPITLTR